VVRADRVAFILRPCVNGQLVIIVLPNDARCQWLWHHCKKKKLIMKKEEEEKKKEKKVI
jgi:hypothetical protein